jgi:glycosyltransferase involved in cell wall biosynthesis
MDMRVLALTPNLYGVSPGQRSSIELWDKVLRPAGIAVDHVPFETEELRRVIYQPGQRAAKAAELLRAYWRRLLSLRALSDYDAVLVYREAALIGPELIERWTAHKGKPIIYQLDDPLYVPYRSPWSGWASYLKFFGKVKRIIGLSDVVIVNSRHHREYAERYSRNVWQVPSVVDADVYRYKPRPPSGDRVCIGWSGSPTTVGNLTVIADPLRHVVRRTDVSVEVIGAADPPLGDVPVTVRPWRAETEVDDLRHLDIGLLPVPYSEWNKRKFFMKLVQYMALGIPAVCTPIGSTPDVVEEGRTGFLADTPEEWLSHLERLARDGALRAQMSAHAADVAHERYTLQANAERIVAAFRSALR